MTSMGSVLVAMSGGVDSSVAACLLKEQGYDVVGSHMNLVHLDGVEHGCCGPAARADAGEVARIAGIPFEIVDLSGEFAATVIDDFIGEHEAGRTPNPCARCNGEIKFGAFLRRADELGIDLVATGHYVRSLRDDGGAWHLLRGADADKDQSYMLHMLGQRQLSRSRFPIGGMPKAETRAHAARFGLPVASKPDSQELCFAPSGDAGAFVRSAAPQLVHEGAVVDTEGQEIGDARWDVRVHGGAASGTGCRDGRAPLRRRRRCREQPRDGRAAGTAVATGTRRRPRLVGVRPRPDDGPFEASVRIRYRGDDVPAVIEPLDGERIRVEFRSPQRAVAPGQSVVMYAGDEVLGGGRILEALR